MGYRYEFSKQFQRGLIKIEKGDPNRINKIKQMIGLIINNPFNEKLNFEKLSGEKRKNIYRYYIGMKYRLKIEIIFNEKQIKFLKIGRRENFY